MQEEDYMDFSEDPLEESDIWAAPGGIEMDTGDFVVGCGGEICGSGFRQVSFPRGDDQPIEAVVEVSEPTHYHSRQKVVGLQVEGPSTGLQQWWSEGAHLGFSHDLSTKSSSQPDSPLVSSLWSTLVIEDGVLFVGSILTEGFNLTSLPEEVFHLPVVVTS
jgi:hypothetical protein